MNDPQLPMIVKFSPSKQRQLDQLLDQNAEGTIEESDRAKLATLVAEAEELILANSKRLAEFTQKQSTAPPLGAVPVTIWVSSETAVQ